MKIRIKSGQSCSQNAKLDKFLKANAGKFVKVETDHLFDNQYNTAKFRIFDSDVSEVKDDARKDKGVCKFCGTLVTAPKECKKYTKSRPSKFCNKVIGICSQYGTEWFTEANTYFLKYPKGFNELDEVESQSVGSYFLKIDNGFYHLQNSRKKYKFLYNKERKEFIVFDSMGAKIRKYLNIPKPAMEKLLKILNK